MPFLSRTPALPALIETNLRTSETGKSVRLNLKISVPSIADRMSTKGSAPVTLHYQSASIQHRL